jgi:hypothetical protein
MNNLNFRNFRICLIAETSVSKDYEKGMAREELTDVRSNLIAGKIFHQ